MAAQPHFSDVDAYMAAAPAPAEAAMREVRALIHRLVPEVTERISYQIPLFELNGRRLAYIAAYKAHIGMYGISGIREEFGERIAAYVNDKGTLRFPLREPMPLDLIEDIIRFSRGQVLAMKPAEKKRG